MLRRDISTAVVLILFICTAALADPSIDHVKTLIKEGAYAPALTEVDEMLKQEPENKILLNLSKALKSKLAAARSSSQPAVTSQVAATNRANALPPSPREQLELKTVQSIMADLAVAANDPSGDEKVKLLAEDILKRTAPLAERYPGVPQIWVFRAAAALALDNVEVGAAAGQRLIALDATASEDPAVSNLMVQLNRKGWLDENLGKASTGDADAMVKLGWQYANGVGVEQSDTECIRLWKKAAELGNASAMEYLGNAMHSGDQGLNRNLAEAKAVLTRAVELGNAPAKITLAYVLSDLEGDRNPEVERLVNDAVSQLEIAAQHGDIRSKACLGRLYLIGLSVAKDFDRAVGYCLEAADLGDARSMAFLAHLYTNGDQSGKGKNLEAAKSWGQKSADKGDALGMVISGFFACDRDWKKIGKESIDWFQRAASKGTPEAMYNLGWCCANGQGVPVDIAQSKAWYQKAAEAGFKPAIAELAKLNTLVDQWIGTWTRRSRVDPEAPYDDNRNSDRAILKVTAATGGDGAPLQIQYEERRIQIALNITFHDDWLNVPGDVNVPGDYSKTRWKSDGSQDTSDGNVKLDSLSLSNENRVLAIRYNLDIQDTNIPWERLGPDNPRGKCFFLNEVEDVVYEITGDEAQLPLADLGPKLSDKSRIRYTREGGRRKPAAAATPSARSEPTTQLTAESLNRIQKNLDAMDAEKAKEANANPASRWIGVWSGTDAYVSDDKKMAIDIIYTLNVSSVNVQGGVELKREDVPVRGTTEHLTDIYPGPVQSVDRGKVKVEGTNTIQSQQWTNAGTTLTLECASKFSKHWVKSVQKSGNAVTWKLTMEGDHIELPSSVGNKTVILRRQP